MDQSAPNLAAPAEEEFFSENALGSLHEINGSFLRLMMELAADPDASAVPRFVVALGAPLRSLDARSLARLAACHISLLDIAFMDCDRWKAIEKGQVPAPSDDNGFPRVKARHLAHAALTLAWTVVRFNKESARVVFGMTPAVAESMARIGVQSILEVAERYPHWVRPRWVDRPQIWRNSVRLAHARGNDVQAPSMNLYLLQHQLSDLVPGTAAHNATRADT